MLNHTNKIVQHLLIYRVLFTHKIDILDSFSSSGEHLNIDTRICAVDIVFMAIAVFDNRVINHFSGSIMKSPAFSMSMCVKDFINLFSCIKFEKKLHHLIICS